MKHVSKISKEVPAKAWIFTWPQEVKKAGSWQNLADELSGRLPHGESYDPTEIW